MLKNVRNRKRVFHTNLTHAVFFIANAYFYGRTESIFEYFIRRIEIGPSGLTVQSNINRFNGKKKENITFDLHFLRILSVTPF